ncbi:hypothetical protein ACF0H5_003140 [Mactra antiquata]
MEEDEIAELQTEMLLVPDEIDDIEKLNLNQSMQEEDYNNDTCHSTFDDSLILNVNSDDDDDDNETNDQQYDNIPPSPIEFASANQNDDIRKKDNTLLVQLGLKQYQPPPLLTRHPPPAIGRDDDIHKLREILDDVMIKTAIMRMQPKFYLLLTIMIKLL